jgi:hypothetical protein
MLIRAMLATVAVCAACSAQAAVIDFGANSCADPCVNGAEIRQKFGDTTGLNVVYNDSSSGSMRFWADGYSGLQGVAYGASGLPASIWLKPEDGYKVTLKGFSLGAWNATSRASSYRILDGRGSLLFDSGSITVSGSTPTVVSGSWKGRKGIVIDFGPDAYNVGIDLITYKLKAPDLVPVAQQAATFAGSAVVPLPAGLPLLAGALGLLGFVRRRRCA